MRTGMRSDVRAEDIFRASFTFGTCHDSSMICEEIWSSTKTLVALSLRYAIYGCQNDVNLGEASASRSAGWKSHRDVRVRLRNKEMRQTSIDRNNRIIPAAIIDRTRNSLRTEHSRGLSPTIVQIFHHRRYEIFFSTRSRDYLLAFTPAYYLPTSTSFTFPVRQCGLQSAMGV